MKFYLKMPLMQDILQLFETGWSYQPFYFPLRDAEPRQLTVLKI